jgi:cbb3-type cytochrome oxidase maturation protein
MDVLYLLIPLSLVLVGFIVWAFFWAVRSGQMDDLEGPGHAVLMDDDSPPGRASSDDREATGNRAPRDARPEGE